MSKHQKRPTTSADTKGDGKDAFEEVVALIKERRKYADWISALEAKRDKTPPAVFAKVHLDYETRLAAVTEKLSAHRGLLADEERSLKQKLAEVETEIESHEEVRAETELRAHVGELTAAALTEALRTADTELERLRAQRNSIEINLTRVAEFFAAAEGTGSATVTPPPPPTPRASGSFDELSFLNSVVGPVPAAPPPPKAESSPPPARPVEVPATPEVQPPPRPSVPEKPAIPEPAPSRPSQPVKTPEPTPSRPSQPEKPTDPPQARPSQVKPAPESARSSQPELPMIEAAKPEPASVKAAEPAPVEKPAEPEMPRPVPRQTIAMQMAALTLDPESTPADGIRNSGIIKTGDELPPSILEDLKPKNHPLAANVAANDPLSLNASAGGELKTLKCRECGAMNNPAEWYCERCGAELSSL